MKKIKVLLVLMCMFVISMSATFATEGTKYSVDVNTDGTRDVWITASETVTCVDGAKINIDSYAYMIDNDKLLPVQYVNGGSGTGVLDWLDDGNEGTIFNQLQTTMKNVGKGFHTTLNLGIHIIISIVAYIVVGKLIVQKDNAGKSSDNKSQFGAFVVKVLLALSINTIIEILATIADAFGDEATTSIPQINQFAIDLTHQVSAVITNVMHMM